VFFHCWPPAAHPKMVAAVWPEFKKSAFWQQIKGLSPGELLIANDASP
jgi:hypothetical protein